MADNDYASVSEAHIDASLGTGQIVPESHPVEDMHNETPTQQSQTRIDTSATTTTATITDDQQQPPETVAMSSESQQSPPPPGPEQEDVVSSQKNGVVEQGDTIKVSDVSSDRPPLRDEGFEQVRLDTEGQTKQPQGNKTNSFLILYCLCHFSMLNQRC
jgi:hypothetical protein